VAHFDLAIIGTGSGNSLVTPDFDDKRVAVIESGKFGGTCVNVGCIPTKMYVYAADVANTITHAGKFGIDATLYGVRWTDVRDRIFARIDAMAESGKDYRVNGPNTTAFLGHATFTGPKALHVDTGDEVTADQIVIATGAHPFVPTEVSDSGVPFHTSDTIMRLDELPKRLVILGSGFIAAEFAHIFSAFGSKVTVVARHDALLRQLDTEISRRFTKIAREQWDVRLNATLTKLTGDKTEIRLDFADGSHASGDILLVATGRKPSTAHLGLDKAGIETREDGRVKVDEYGRTSVDGVWSLGDVSSDYQLKHVANHEARIVAHNLAPPRRPPHLRPPLRPRSGLHLSADRQRRTDRRTAQDPGPQLRHHDAGVRRYGIRLGDGGHHRGLQADRGPGHGRAARRPPHGLPGVEPDRAADPGDVTGAERAADGAGPVLDPPRAHRGRRERLARPRAHRRIGWRAWQSRVGPGQSWRHSWPTPASRSPSSSPSC